MFLPIEALRRHRQRYSLDTDACEYQIEFAFWQRQPNKDKHPVGYWSWRLSALQKRCSTAKRECLAVLWSIFTLRTDLYGDTITLCADCHAFKYILNLADSSGQLALWRFAVSVVRLRSRVPTGDHAQGSRGSVPSTEK